MPLTYAEIFEQRGSSHSDAFKLFPRAVIQEVGAVLDLANLQPGEVVLDVPSASSFLFDAINLPNIRYIAIDPSAQMYDISKSKITEAYCAPMNCLPLPQASVDVIVCLAGLHHENNWFSIFQEMNRVLKPFGRLAISEVESGSPVANFLNNFVNLHSSTGHDGKFVDDQFVDFLYKAQFEIQVNRSVNYYWEFDSVNQMGRCFQLMFGIDGASEQDIIRAVEEVLGVDRDIHGNYLVRWGMRHILAQPNIFKDQ